MATEVETPPPVVENTDQESSETAKMEPELKAQVRKAFLNLKVTVCINLNKNDIAGFNTPQPYYVRKTSLLLMF